MIKEHWACAVAIAFYIAGAVLGCFVNPWFLFLYLGTVVFAVVHIEV